jgi:hypothetical protein
MQRDLLGVNVGVVGFGGTRIQSYWQLAVPPIGTSYSLLWSGQARSFSPNPDMIVINEGAKRQWCQLGNVPDGIHRVPHLSPLHPSDLTRSVLRTSGRLHQSCGSVETYPESGRHS